MVHIPGRTLIAAALAAVLQALSGTPLAVSDPLPGAAGVFKLGSVPGAGSTGIPYVLPDGTTGVLTAGHGVGPPPDSTHWAITDAHGDAGYGIVRAWSGTAFHVGTDAAFLQTSTQWANAPRVKLSDDYAATFAATATPADVKVGDRVCRTGWSPLDGDGLEADGTPNVVRPPDVPSVGASIICGRVTDVDSTSDGHVADAIYIGRSDRPDGAIISRGDSGGAVWKPTTDGSFLFVGMMTNWQGTEVGSVGGLPTYPGAKVRAAWSLNTNPDLAGARPMLTTPTDPWFVISTSTYHPMAGAGVQLQGSLREPDGRVLASKTVHVLAGPTLAEVGSTITDNDGNFTFPTATITASTPFAFRWAGDTTHPAVASRMITITPTRAVVTNPPSDVTAGGTVTVTGLVTDTAGLPLPGRTVALQIYADGGTSYTVAATATTDVDGHVSFTTPTVTSSESYAIRLNADPSSNGDPLGAAASPIYPLTVR